MRHKQRPIKSSRHKSVTFIIDSSQTSFIDNNNHNHPLDQQQQQFQAQQNEQFHQYDDYNQPTDHDDSHQNHRQNNSSYDTSNLKHQSSTSDGGPPFMRKQFEHNVRHMSDIMRLAFLENNDICPETWGDVDFNSLSTASILQRNIQHQLQQQRREQQLQLRQKQHQQQQQQHQHQHQHQQQLHQQQQQQNQHQQSRHWQTQKSQQQRHQQQQPQHNAYLAQAEQQFHQDDDYQTFSDVDIFATAMPTTSSSSRQNRNISSTPRATSSNFNENNSRKPIRVRDAHSSLAGVQQDMSSHSAQEVEVSMVNQGDGFHCDDPGCGKTFSSLRKLRHHKVVHSDDFPFVCQFKGCGKKFKRKFGIDLHSTTHFDLDPDMYNKTSNNSSLPFFGRRMQYSMCKPCGQKFKTVHEYQYHMLKHGKEPFKCPVKGCGQTFSIWKSFQKHRASHYFNYYCKMDPSCNHHTSNLQLLKLHIYCCHFRRHLPENATLSSKDRAEEEDSKDERIEVVDNEDQQSEPSQSMETEIDPNDVFEEEEEQDDDDHHHHHQHHQRHEDEVEQEQISYEEVKPVVTTPRRDARLRENPPRSSTFGRQDYASINNGKSFAKVSPSAPTGTKRTRASMASGSSQSQSEHLHQLQQPQHHQQHQPHRRAREQQHQYREDFDDDEFHDANGDEDDDYEESNNRIFGATTSNNPSSKNSTPVKATSSGINRNKKTARGKEISPRAAAQSNQSAREEMIPINYGEGFFCDEPGCGKSFPSVRKLRHHKVVHSDEFPFVCQFQGCGKKFKRKFGIDLHSTTHFDLDPDMYNKTSNNSSLPYFGRRMQYSMCKPCGQKFKTVHEYQYHMLKHGKEPFKCPVKGCGQTFSIWKSFQKHRASHYFNYYCKMDPGCDHHTSNLQLLKLHIYCCHFRRVLPANATLSSKDRVQEEDDSKMEVSVDVVDNDDSELHLDVDGDNQPEDSHFEPSTMGETSVKLEPSMDVPEAQREAEPEPATPRRDSRLRKNPPRSSTYCHQDYASVNNGKGSSKSSSTSLSTPTSVKRARSSAVAASSTQSSPEKKPKLPLKVLPKRSAQRLPMSLLAADDASTEDDEDDDQAHSSDDDSSLGRSRDVDSAGGGGGHEDGADDHEDPTGQSRFRCHLCDFKFNVRFQLTKHLSTHLELTSDMYLATADMKVIKLSERRRREFFCDKCSLKFEQMSDLDVHMRKHGQRPYVCNFCPQRSTFRLAKQYLSHLYEHRFIYKCLMDPKCEFTINRKDALKLHVFRMHLNQKLPSYLENYATIFNENEF